jgi:hypothetical protein
LPWCDYEGISAKARHALPAAPGSSACMGEPWEIKMAGSMNAFQKNRLSPFSQKNYPFPAN